MKALLFMPISNKGDAVIQDPHTHTRARTHAHARTRTHAHARATTPQTESLRHQNRESDCNINDLEGDSGGTARVIHGDSAAPPAQSSHESQVQRRIVNALIRAGYWPEVLVQGAGVPKGRDRPIWFGMTRGAPDVWVVGENLMLEVKSSTGRLTPEQVAYRARARRFGAVVATVRSEQDALAAVGGLQALRAMLGALGRLVGLVGQI